GAVLGKALIDAYGDLFTVSEYPTEKDREGIEGKFKSTHNATDRVAKQQAITFYALLKLADLKAARSGGSSAPRVEVETPPPPTDRTPPPARREGVVDLRYNIEVHLPPTKDIEVYNAIFKSLREHLLVD